MNLESSASNQRTIRQSFCFILKVFAWPAFIVLILCFLITLAHVGEFPTYEFALVVIIGFAIAVYLGYRVLRALHREQPWIALLFAACCPAAILLGFLLAQPFTKWMHQQFAYMQQGPLAQAFADDLQETLKIHHPEFQEFTWYMAHDKSSDDGKWISGQIFKHIEAIIGSRRPIVPLSFVPGRGSPEQFQEGCFLSLDVNLSHQGTRVDIEAIVIYPKGEVSYMSGAYLWDGDGWKNLDGNLLEIVEFETEEATDFIDSAPSS